MPKQSAEAEPNAVHAILRHVRDFSYLRVKELLGMFKETASEWMSATSSLINFPSLASQTQSDPPDADRTLLPSGE